ncbi:MAG: PA2778 family cysteine peptidase [Halofilum sp. (in: g-proteobacteria)]|nr:PA2778 family cysteine peptidase [Halofilum sp. (in: g-proteobacteria)]
MPRRARPRAGTAGLLFLALASGCASTPQTRALLDQPPSALPAQRELSSVTFHPQERYQCGPAALATVLDHAGMPTAPDALVDEVYLPKRHGTLPTEMRAATRARGLLPYPLAPEMNALVREVATGRPVLVMQNLGLDWFPQWHFAVVVGYDLDRAEVVLRSGTTRRLVTSMRVFERTWARSGHWAQVVVQPADIPATAEPLRWLETVRELEPRHPEAAAGGYRAATERWPDSHEAWMTRANAAYARDDMQAARDGFTRAVEIAPEKAPGWNNLAYPLAALGCDTAARAAASCAVALAPDDPGPRDTLREIRSMTSPDESQRCGIPQCPVAVEGTTNEHE